MKQVILCLTALLLTIQTLPAHNKKELAASLSRDLEAYKQYTLAGDFDKSFQFMPPKMFDIIPRDSLLSTMRQAMDNEYMTIDLTAFQYKSEKYKIKKAGMYNWAYISYDGSMRLRLKGEEEFKTLMITMMKAQFGSENVQMEGESAMLISMKKKRLIAFKDPASATWSLIEDKRFDKGQEGEMQKALLQSILPEEVLKAVGK